MVSCGNSQTSPNIGGHGGGLTGGTATSNWSCHNMVADNIEEVLLLFVVQVPKAILEVVQEALAMEADMVFVVAVLVGGLVQLIVLEEVVVVAGLAVLKEIHTLQIQEEVVVVVTHQIFII